MSKKNKDKTLIQGMGIDAFGHQVKDPTTNVNQLFEKEAGRVNDLRKANEKLSDYQIASIKEIVFLKTDHLKEVQDLHQMYNDKLENKESERLDAKALAVEAQLTIQRERDATQATLLAKTVEQNADKIKTDLESSKKENNDRFLRVENTLSINAGKSAGATSTVEWIIRVVLFLLALAGFGIAYYKP